MARYISRQGCVAVDRAVFAPATPAACGIGNRRMRKLPCVAAIRDGRYHHGNLRTALEEAVLQIVVEHGVDAVTMAAAARIAGVTPGAPYRHFDSLDDLIGSTAASCVSRFEATLHYDEIYQAPGDGEKALLALIPMFFEYARREPAAFALIFDSRSAAGARAIRPTMLRLFERMQVLVADAVDRTPSECRDLALAISGIAMGQVRLLFADFSPLASLDEAARVATQGVRLLLAGYRAEGR
jgi:AcrR family transcriptional regulator